MTKLAPRSFYLFVPLLIVLLFLALNLRKPVEPEAPKDAPPKEVEEITVLVKDPITGIYPNPKRDSSNQDFNANIFDGLVNLRSGEIENSLITGWENPDPLTWVLQLKTGIKFSNGQELKPEDVKASVEEAMRKDWPIDPDLKNIRQVTTRDTKIEIKLNSPISSFILMLKSIPILPKSALDSNLAIGTGPYRLTENKPSQSQNSEEQTVILEINPHYWGKTPKVKKIVFQYINPTKTRNLDKANLNNYALIETNALEDSLQTELLTRDYTKINISQPNFEALVFNFNSLGKSHPLAQKKIRQIISSSLDINPLLKEGLPVGQLSTRNSFGYNPNITRPGINRIQNKKQLNELGYSGGFRFELLTPASKLEQAKVIASQLKELEIQVDINAVNPDSENSRLRSREFQVYFGSYQVTALDTGSIFSRFLISRSPENYSGFNHATVEEKTTLLETTTDLNTREAIIHDLLEITTEELPWIPLWEKTKTFLVKDHLDFIPTTPYILGTAITGK